MDFPSKLVQTAVEEIAKLPGIGKKSALRIVFHLLKEDIESSQALVNSLIKLRTEIQYCQTCCNIADKPICSICENLSRDHTMICLVENPKDVIAIENTAQYKGVYHVLGGLISPIEGKSPQDLNIDQLISRIEKGTTKELIFALSPTMEGDTTTFYLTKKLKTFPLKITTLARGVAIGGEIEYTDEVTLGRSILTRTVYE